MKPRQKKSRTYYYFWGLATIAVISGQFYVGSGYRRMSESMDAISADINLLVEVLTHTGGVKEYEISIEVCQLSDEYLDREICPPQSAIDKWK